MRGLDVLLRWHIDDCMWDDLSIPRPPPFDDPKAGSAVLWNWMAEEGCLAATEVCAAEGGHIGFVSARFRVSQWCV